MPSLLKTGYYALILAIASSLQLLTQMKILLQKKPDITSTNAEWVLRELIAVKRCNDNTDTNLDEQIAEIKRQYGNFA